MLLYMCAISETKHSFLFLLYICYTQSVLAISVQFIKRIIEKKLQDCSGWIKDDFDFFPHDIMHDNLREILDSKIIEF